MIGRWQDLDGVSQHFQIRDESMFLETPLLPSDFYRHSFTTLCGGLKKAPFNSSFHSTKGLCMQD